MSEYTNELMKIGYFLGMSFALALILLVVVYIISFTSKVDFEKSSAYECGFQPFSETNYPFEVQFALIAILFLLFDIEILFLYPLCTSILEFNSIEVFYLISFFIIVTVGLLYEISRRIVHFFDYDDPSTLKGHYALLLFLPGHSDFLMFLLFSMIAYVIYFLLNRFFFSMSSFFILSFLILVVLAFISFLFPMFSFFFMLFISLIIFLVSLPFELYKGFSVKQQLLLQHLLIFLHNSSILDFLAVVYIKFFCVPRNIFIIRLCLLFFISVVYIYTSRWYFYQSVFLHTQFTFFQKVTVYIILLLGLIILYLRIFLSLSMYFTFTTLRLNKSLLSPVVLYVLGEGDDTPLTSSSNEPNPSNRRFSLINITYTRKYFHQYFSSGNNGGYKSMTIGISLFAVGAAAAAAYYGKLQVEATDRGTEATNRGTEATNKQTAATNRETDVAAVDAGLISKDEYYRRHPGDRPS